MEQMEIADVNVSIASSYGRYRWFEAKVTAFEGDKMIRFDVELPIDELKEMGVCKTLGSWKAVRAWVQTDEGEAYIIRNRNRNYFNEIRNAV